MGSLIFNGISTDSVTLGVIIQTPPVYEFPSRRINTVQIQGKNGDIIIDKNSFDNVTREYNLASVAANTSFVEKARAIVDWLSSVSGYAKLEDSYEPLYFRHAMYRSGGKLPNFYDKATAIIVKFECKPQRFLKTGDVQQVIYFQEQDFTFQEITGNSEIEYIALPEIEVVGGFTSIEIRNGDDVNNPDSVTIITLTDNTIVDKIIIDSEMQDVYNTTGYINNKITIEKDGEVSYDLPKLYPGKNWIGIVGTPTSLKIKPRWWVL